MNNENNKPCQLNLIAALPGSIRTSDMAQKVTTERKMKLRQGTTSLGQIATVTAKPRINDKEGSFG